jgi:hypothetical protein
MELGQYEEALQILREILPMKPCDSVALTSLGLCLSALGYQPHSSSSSSSSAAQHCNTTNTNGGHTATGVPTNYALKIKLMDDPHEFTNSTDPEELLEAGSTFNLSNIFYQVPPLPPPPSLPSLSAVVGSVVLLTLSVSLPLCLCSLPVWLLCRSLEEGRVVILGRAGASLGIMATALAPQRAQRGDSRRRIRWNVTTQMCLPVCSTGMACIVCRGEVMT